ncbi:MAG: hypothetical protein FD189_429 [Elusimicrobia bacterium]|nr:MAG: hypothetical protein FD154_536 [Elusimicrobiota bacterium]KAF0157654.1 MAG: hypothetical protein FD189_429 [Elusimicrobiota bacterium]
MKNLLLPLLLAAAPAAALDFDSPARGNAAFAGALRPAPVLEVARLPLDGLWAERLSSAKHFVLDGTAFLARVSFDPEWNIWLGLKAEEAGAPDGAWKEDALAAGATYRYSGGTLSIKSEDGTITISDGKDGSLETSIAELFDLLYAGSSKLKFADLVEYAVVRNSDPVSQAGGTVTLRIGSDGLYYYSLTSDVLVTGQPRWLLAINGVLYGLKYAPPDLVFVSKEIEMKTDLPEERTGPRRR